MTQRVILLALTLLTACDSIPQDASGTVKRIQSDHVMHAGLVSGTRNPETAQLMLTKLAAQWNARVEWHTAPASIMLDKLEKGELDVVVGEFAQASPLKTDVSFSQAVAQPEPQDNKLPVLRIARAHGENRLISVTDKMVMP